MNPHLPKFLFLLLACAAAAGAAEHALKQPRPDLFTGGQPSAQQLRVSVLPSFAQRWLLPRMTRWHKRHPDLSLQIETSQQVVDLLRDGFHAALRFGRGPWPGVESEPLFDMPLPLIALASPETAAALPDNTPETLARQPLLGDRDMWQHWFNAAGLSVPVTPVA